MWKHWVLRSCTPYKPFADESVARKAWNALISCFPNTLSAVLMPNHLHILLPATETVVLEKLGGLTGTISRETGIRNLWQPIPLAVSIPDKFHLKRQVRYVALNPCRKGLCQDPLEWAWSTHRDSIGASINPALNKKALLHALGEDSHGFEARLHTYVSSDPSVSVSGTAFPKPISSKILPEEPIILILKAAAGAFRLNPIMVKSKGPLRSLFLHLAKRQGWKSPSLLARICHMSPQAVTLNLKQKPPPGMSAAILCLGDNRLTQMIQLSKSII